MRISRYYKGSISLIILILCLTTAAPIPSQKSTLAVTRIITEVNETSMEPYEGHTLISGIDPVFEVNQTGYVTWFFSKRTAPGIIPHSIPLDADRLPNNNTLITYYNETLTTKPDYPKGTMGYPSIVAEVNTNGDVVWNFTTGLDFAHDADKLPNGNTIIADSSPNVHNERIIEVDPSGNVVWEYKTGNGSYPNDVDVLPNGNVFISLRDWNSLLEVNRQGEIVWFYNGTSILTKQHNPDVLLNNHILVCDSGNNRILELDRTGKIITECAGEGAGGLNWPRDADRLPNGNTLITDSRAGSVTRVIEINSKGDLVWGFEAPVVFGNLFYESDRLNVPPSISIESPSNNVYPTTKVEIVLSSTALDLDHMWFRIHDDSRNQWLDPANVTYKEPVSRALVPGKYTIYAWANDTGDFTLGDPNWSMIGGPAIVTFTVGEVSEFQNIGVLCVLSFLFAYSQKKKKDKESSVT